MTTRQVRPAMRRSRLSRARSAGQSLDHGVRVLGVNPGWVDTTRACRDTALRTADSGTFERWRDVIRSWGLPRYIRPEEIADVVAFLASDRASAVCGEGSMSPGFRVAQLHMSPIGGAASHELFVAKPREG